MAHFAILEKYQRFWLDAPHRAIFGSGLSRSLRQREHRNGQPRWEQAWACAPSYRRINQLEARLAQAHREPISEVPAGQTQHEGIQEDSRKRKRHYKRGKRIVVLVALGLWTDGSGKRHILDWEVAEKEEQAAWERLVQRLWERGVKLETGLQAIVRDGSEGLEQALDYVYGSALVQQRCIFHKLRNVRDKCSGLDREGKKSLVEQTAAVYQATSAPEARARLLSFWERWRATQPQAIATFEREAGADHPLLFVGGDGARSGVHDLVVGTDEPGAAAQVSASGLFRQSQGSRGGGLHPGEPPECGVGPRRVGGRYPTPSHSICLTATLTDRYATDEFTVLSVDQSMCYTIAVENVPVQCNVTVQEDEQGG